MKKASREINQKIIQLQETAQCLAENIYGPWIVSKEQQKKELNILKILTRSEHFFFITDLSKHSMVHSGGIERWLGYREIDFTMHDYFRILHPSFVDAALLNTSMLYNLLCSGTFKPAFMQSWFPAQHILRHANGNYIFAKLMSTPFQMNNKGQVTELLNNFIIIGPYKNITAGFVFARYQYDDYLLAAVHKHAKVLLPFSEQEYNVLKKMAEHPYAVAEKIATLLSIEKSTLNTYKKRLLPKAREYTQLPFKEAAEVAMFFRQQGML